MDKLHQQIAFELEQLHRLIETHRSLLTKCAEIAPDSIELSALATLIHSFYSGIENIFKRIAVVLDHSPPKGDAWHQGLLEAMSRSTEKRPVVISTELRSSLKEYLGFRHVFRHVYAFELQWKKVAPLILECEKVLTRLESELQKFMERP